ncbi:MAG TPA: aspartate/glutamate racemase family protein [Candidatus Tumulicola sp.]
MNDGPKSLGLIVGIGPSAGIYYYRHLVRAFNTLPEPPRFFLAHADVATLRLLVAADDRDGMADYLAAFVEGLASAGCDVAAISATTAHLCFQQLITRSTIPIVSMLPAVRKGIRDSGFRRIALFGTRQTIESDLFGSLPDVDVVRPSANEVDQIAAIYARAVDRFGATPDDLFALEAIAKNLSRREAIEAVLVAGTDFSDAFEKYRPDYPFVDVSHLHIAAILESIASA